MRAMCKHEAAHLNNRCSARPDLAVTVYSSEAGLCKHCMQTVSNGKDHSTTRCMDDGDTPTEAGQARHDFLE